MRQRKRLISLVLSLCITISMIAGFCVPTTAAGLSLAQLQEKFPDGRYWNGGDPDKTTSTPCAKHTSGVNSTCNYFSCGSAAGWQCYGFALKLAYDAYGQDPGKWTRGAKDLSDLKAGDILNYNGTGHTVFITQVNGNDVTFADCNSNYQCIIRWGVHKAKANFNNVLSVYSAPYPLDSSPTPSPALDDRYPLPFKCYAYYSGDHNTFDNTHACEAFDSINGSRIGYIYTGDCCTVKEIYTNGWCLANIPWNGSTKDVYASASNFVDFSFTPTVLTAPQKATTWKRLRSTVDAGVFGWIDPGDKLFIVNNSYADRVQVIYPLSDGTKMCGWVAQSDIIHTHSYETGYEAVHPHREYKKCSCGDVYYTGNTVYVASCTECNPQSVAYPLPFKGYCYYSGDHNTFDNTHACEAYDSINGSRIGYIYTGDYCTVKEIYSNGWCLVNIPWNGSTKDVYASASNFVDLGFTPVTRTVHIKATTWKRLGSTVSAGELGWVDPGEKVIIVNESYSDRVQIMYPHSDGIYRCAWVSRDAFAHTPGAAATCTATQTCTVCGEVINAALGHNYSSTVNNEDAHPHRAYKKCTRCGNVSYTGNTKLVSSCAECYPLDMPSISIAKTVWSEDETVNMTWTACKNADYYYPLTLNSTMDERIDVIWGTTDRKYEIQLPAGSYGLQVGCYNHATGQTIWSGVVSIEVKEKNYAIIYDPNNGTNAPAAQTKRYAVDLTLSKTKPVRSGYTFLGWASNLDASVAEYQPGDTYKENADQKLYAVWKTATIPVASISLDKPAASLRPGDSLPLSASVKPTNATNKAVNWSSSNAAVASVSADGIVAAKSAGTATITVEAADGSGAEATCTVSVVAQTLPEEADVLFTLSKTSGRPGDTVKVTLSVASEVEINTIGLNNLVFDSSVLTFVGFTDYGALITQSMLPSGATDGEKATITLMYEQSAKLSGTICALEFKINEDVTDVSSAISMESIVKRTSAIIPSAVVGGEIAVTNELMGDINGDGLIDIDDVTMLMQYSIFPEIYPITYRGNTDYNHDGATDIDDIVMLLQYSIFPDIYPLS